MKWLLLLLFAASGCGGAPTDTADIATDEIELQMLVETGEETARVQVALYYHEDHSVFTLGLAAGDRLVARVGDRSFEPRADSFRYVFDLPKDTTAFELDFLRDSHASAKGTHVELPAPFRITPPGGDGLVHLQKPFTLSWSPASAESSMKLALDGACLGTAQRTLATDTGTFTWSVADYLTRTTPSPCTVTAHVTRQGGSLTLAPGWGGLTSFRASQSRGLGLWAIDP